MSLDKAIKYGKEKRKPYRGAKAIDAFCRNHGECTYCMSNRLHNRRVAEEAAKQKEKMYRTEETEEKDV